MPKMHLTPKGVVKNRSKILEYLCLCFVFESIFAAPLGVIYYFGDRFYFFNLSKMMVVKTINFAMAVGNITNIRSPAT